MFFHLRSKTTFLKDIYSISRNVSRNSTSRINLLNWIPWFNCKWKSIIFIDLLPVNKTISSLLWWWRQSPIYCNPDSNTKGFNSLLQNTRWVIIDCQLHFGLSGVFLFLFCLYFMIWWVRLCLTVMYKVSTDPTSTLDP